VIIAAFLAAVGVLYATFVVVHSGAHRRLAFLARRFLVAASLTMNGVFVTKDDPDDPAERAWLYRTEEGPHEPSALTRLSQYGWPAHVLTKLFNKSIAALSAHLDHQREVRERALREGRALHDKPAPKGSK
jgi:hypothetical protein